MQLCGKNVILTGAANGIGKATAIELAKVGVNLFLVDIDEKGLKEVQKEIENFGVECNILKVNISNRNSVKTMVENAILKYKNIDILINVAGVTLIGEVYDYEIEDWDWIIGINLLGPIFTIHYILPHMIKKKSGYIVNVSSAAGLVSIPGNSAYCTTKYGLVGFTEVLRSELKDFNIGVSLLCPGGVKTKFEDHARIKGWTKFKRGYFLPGKKKTPEFVALKLIKAIEKEKFLIIIGFLPKLFFLLKRFFPKLYYFIGTKQAKSLVKWR